MPAFRRKPVLAATVRRSHTLRFSDSGNNPPTLSPSLLRELVKGGIVKWNKMITVAKIAAQ
jgi:hypothetical protein